MENLLFSFFSFTTFSMLRSLSRGYVARGLTMSNALLPHSYPWRTLLQVAKRSRFNDMMPPHASLARVPHCFSTTSVDCPFGATRMEFESLASTNQPIPLANLDNSTWLHDSVRQATSKVQWHFQDFSDSPKHPCHSQGD